MAVEEIAKERGVWCAHAGHAGCHIYDGRPGACRDFNCRWLADSRFGGWWFPQKSKIVVDAQIDETGMTVSFHVDPKYPGRWREDPYFRDIKAIAAAGLKQKPGWLTVVVVGRRVIPFAD